MKYLVRALGVVLVFELVLLFSGIVPPNVAAILIVATEATAFVLGGSIFVKLIKQIRLQAKQGKRVYEAMEKSLEGALPPKALFMVKHEIGVFISLGRLIVRKKDIPSGAVEIKYGKTMRVFIAILIAASIVEIAAVELLVPWDVPRVIILVLSVYGLLWVIGLLAATIVYPHYVTEDSLVIRFFHYQTIVIPLRHFSSIETSERSPKENKTVCIDDGMLSLNVLSSTNTCLVLSEGETILHNGEPVKDITRVAFSTDDKDFARSAITGKATRKSGESFESCGTNRSSLCSNAAS